MGTIPSEQRAALIPEGAEITAVPSVNSSVAGLSGKGVGVLREGWFEGIWVAGGEFRKLRALIIYHPKKKYSTILIARTPVVGKISTVNPA